MKILLSILAFAALSARAEEQLRVTLPATTPKGSAKAAPKAEEMSSEARLALRSVSERYKKLRNWRADFTQETFSVGLGKASIAEGRFYFVMPNKFRYTVGGSEASEFISNGKEAWLVKYPDGRTKPARVQHFKNMNSMELDRYLLVLRGIDAENPAQEKKVLEEFKVDAKTTTSELVLNMEPRKPSEISRVELSFTQDKHPPRKAVLTDALGNTTTLIISNSQSIPAGKAEAFKPEIPKGSQIETL